MKTRLAFLALLLATSAHAQIGVKEPPPAAKIQGPSLEETTQWIIQKMAEFGMKTKENNGEIRSRFYRVTIEGCTATIFTTDLSDRDSYYSSRAIYRFDIDRLSPGGLSVVERDEINPQERHKNALLLMPGGGIQFLYRSRLKSFDDPAYRAEVSKEVDGAPPPRGSSVELYLNGMESAERMMTAWKHAITLCRQKVAAEKAAAPPKPKDLF